MIDKHLTMFVVVFIIITKWRLKEYKDDDDDDNHDPAFQFSILFFVIVYKPNSFSNARNIIT